MKIIDKIKENNYFYSFEYFPPKTKNGLQNLYLKADNLAKIRTSFCRYYLGCWW